MEHNEFNETLFRQKYRIKSARHPFWDYSSDGYYFITICTKHRWEYFGEIKNGMMELSAIGLIAHQYWSEIPNHFPFVRLNEFVVMPNHLHGVIQIVKPSNDYPIVPSSNVLPIPNPVQYPNRVPVPNRVETRHGASLPLGHGIPMEYGIPMTRDNGCKPHSFGPLIPKSLSSIINQYKGAVVRFCNKNNIPFTWQPLYHDHIIRNEKSYEKICLYIQNNPLMWERDRNNEMGLWM